MHTNASDIDTVETAVSTLQTTVAGNTSDISTLQTNVGTNTSDIADLKTADTTLDGKITTAQNTADRADGKADTNATNIANQGLDIVSLQTDSSAHASAITQNTSDISTLQTNLNNFEQMFNLTNVTSTTTFDGFGSITLNSPKLTLAQNSTSSIYKLYGRLEYSNATSTTITVAKSAVTGLSGYYGIKTTLRLTTPPEESYIVDGCEGIAERQDSRDFDTYIASFAVDTDGYIWVCVTTGNNLSVAPYRHDHVIYTPCLYFNTSFGDEPSPAPSA